jgi:hypothetical protein
MRLGERHLSNFDRRIVTLGIRSLGDHLAFEDIPAFFVLLVGLVRKVLLISRPPRLFSTTRRWHSILQPGYGDLGERSTSKAEQTTLSLSICKGTLRSNCTHVFPPENGMADLAKDISDDMFPGPHLSLIGFAAVYVDRMVYEECSSVLSVELLCTVSVYDTGTLSTIGEQLGQIGSRDIISACSYPHWYRTSQHRRRRILAGYHTSTNEYICSADGYSDVPLIEPLRRPPDGSRIPDTQRPTRQPDRS